MRDWWLRTLLVLQRPRPVFVALRETGKEDVSDRSEQVLLVVLLAGLAAVLSTRTAAHLMDDSDFDNLLVAIWAFLAGGVYGLVAYYLFGACLYGGVKALGSQGTYLRARHLLAFAAVPIALSLVLWPVKLALYGDALFRTGGADGNTGGKVFEVLELAFVAWSGVLLVIGVRAVHGWTWARSLAASGIALVVPVALALLAAR